MCRWSADAAPAKPQSHQVDRPQSRTSPRPADRALRHSRNPGLNSKGLKFRAEGDLEMLLAGDIKCSAVSLRSPQRGHMGIARERGPAPNSAPALKSRGVPHGPR